MSTTTETITMRTYETCVYIYDVEVTKELIDEAASHGFPRNRDGVIFMLSADEDHDTVANEATKPENFAFVAERGTEED